MRFRLLILIVGASLGGCVTQMSKREAISITTPHYSEQICLQHEYQNCVGVGSYSACLNEINTYHNPCSFSSFNSQNEIVGKSWGQSNEFKVGSKSYMKCLINNHFRDKNSDLSDPQCKKISDFSNQ